ncbi:histidinol-phosphatase [Acidovorax sp.]|uniref:histidinol-phosphatase n=1 Tax=unclassified Acidovorax TaxID=2684926 RepID=UPI003D045B7B
MSSTTPSPAVLGGAAFVSIALAMADAARAPSMRYFRTPLDVLTKSDESPVTVADRETEAAMRAVLHAQCPDHGILGEEHGRERLEAPHLWVIDPIDGTKSFITGSPLWGTLVALLHQGRPLLGLMDMPVLGERWVGVAGEETQCNGHTVRASTCQALALARIYTTSPDAFTADEWRRFDALSRECALRRFGGDCYSYAQLAAGHVDLVVEAGLQPYDYLALVCLVEGAGGCITDWQGRALSVDSDGRVVAAATPALHALALQRLQGA